MCNTLLAEPECLVNIGYHQTHKIDTDTPHQPYVCIKLRQTHNETENGQKDDIQHQKKTWGGGGGGATGDNTNNILIAQMTLVKGYHHLLTLAKALRLQ